MRVARGVALLAVVAAMTAATPAQAQSQEEQAFIPGGIIQQGCQFLETRGGFLGGLIRIGARALGVCKDTPAQSTTPTTPGPVTPTPTPTPVTAAIQPGLQVRLIQVTGATTDTPNLASATPETVFAQGTGFAVTVAHNSSGYLEVWSVDDSGERMIEAHVLNGAGVITLPKRVQGFYRFTTEGTSDRIRLRFYPCRLGANQAFEPQENAQVAQLLANQEAAVAQLNRGLSTCTFNATLNLQQPNPTFFRNAATRPATFSAESGVYTAVGSGTAPFVTEIVLRRN